jgi:hypothetical protein
MSGPIPAPAAPSRSAVHRHIPDPGASPEGAQQEPYALGGVRRCTPPPAGGLRVLADRDSERLGRSFVAPEAAYAGLRSASFPMEPADRTVWESRLGVDFSSVRIHTNSSAASAARALNARAFTAGDHIVFGPGEYHPGSVSGAGLLGHELGHVLAHRLSGAAHLIGRQLLGEDPLSLHETVLPSKLGDVQLNQEITRLSRWLGRQMMSSPQTAYLGGQLAALQAEQARRGLAQSMLPEPADASTRGQATPAPGSPQLRVPLPATGRPGSTPGPAPTTMQVTPAPADISARQLLNPNEAVRTRLEQIIRTGPLPAKTRVIGAAIIEVEGYRGSREIRAISSAQTDELGAGAAVAHASTPGQRTFNPARSIAGAGHRREFPFSHVNDAEIKIFEEIARNMPAGARGRISFLTMRSRQGGSILEPIPACSSCSNATFDIAGRFRGVQVASYSAVHPTGSLDFSAVRDRASASAGAAGAQRRAAPTTTRTSGGTRTQGSGTRTSRGLRAEIGTPDMRGLHVGGPSARGSARVAGIYVAFMGANLILNTINDQIQQRRAQDALDRIEPTVRQLRREHPDHGVLLLFHYTQIEAPPDSLIQPGAVFGHIEIGHGQSRPEARAQWQAEPKVRPGLGPGSQERTQEVWLPPLMAPSVANLHTPFPKAALARFAPGRAVLQDVQWGGVSGFDDEGTTSLSVPSGVTPTLLVLRVPRQLVFFNGRARVDVDIPIVTRPAASGGSVDAVNLDPVMWGNVAAVCVFPADEASAAIFAGARATHDTLGQLDRYVNFDRARWVRPKNLEVTQRL